tara:strand:+ start:1250 stop:1732 length:483 start_codon:yes stop_codon:yes gene_type:complete
MSEKVKVKIERMYKDVILPKYKHEGDSGMDVHAYYPINPINEDDVFDEIEIHPQETVLIKTGIKVAIPIGYEIQVRPRSGLSLKYSITILNSPGTVDAGYRGEIGVITHNAGNETVHFYHNDRICQIVLQEVPQIEWVEVDSVTIDSTRAEGGFGSTGTN